MNRRSRLAKQLSAAAAAFALCFLVSAGLRAKAGTTDGFGRSFRTTNTGKDVSGDRIVRDKPDATGGRKKKADAKARKLKERSSALGWDSDAMHPVAPADAAMSEWPFTGFNAFPFPQWLRRNAAPKAADLPDPSARYDRLIVKYGRRNGVQPPLLKAVIWKESRFDRNSLGSKGEIGLMQILPEGAVRDWEKAFHCRMNSRGLLAIPELNIEIGSWYLGRALERWKEYDECDALALCEYNAGLQRTNVWKPLLPDGKVIPNIDIESTRKYVEDILEQRDQYEHDWNWEKLK